MNKLIKNIALIVALCLSLAACGQDKQQRNYRVGFVNLNRNLDQVISELQKHLARQGYEPGVNITYLYNGALKNPSDVDQELTKMLAADLDLLITTTTPVTKKAQKLTKGSDMPILFAPVFDPLTSGIVASLARPGANITGLKVRGSTGKALDWLLKAVPATKKVFVPFHHTDPAAIQSLEDLQRAADYLNIELVTTNVSTDKELDNALKTMPEDIDAVWLIHSHLIISNAEKIVARATASHKPTVSSASQYKKGVMLCYAISPAELGAQAGRMADKILRGVSPADLPVESADYFLQLNLKTAHAIGIKIADNIISQADFVTR